MKLLTWCILGFVVLFSACRDSIDSTVLDLVDKNDAEGLRRWNGSPRTLNEHNTNGWTPLMCAAEKGDIALVKILIEKGADVDAKDNQGFTVIAQIDSIVRRITCISAQHKKSYSEKMKREGYSEKEIQQDLQLFDNSLPAHLKDPQLLPKYRAVLDYLRAAHSSTNNLNRVK
jgi:hypothetical protein